MTWWSREYLYDDKEEIEWIKLRRKFHSIEIYDYVCPHCSGQVEQHYPYCPYCGSKMRL